MCMNFNYLNYFKLCLWDFWHLFTAEEIYFERIVKSGNMLYDTNVLKIHPKGIAKLKNNNNQKNLQPQIITKACYKLRFLNWVFGFSRHFSLLILVAK